MGVNFFEGTLAYPAQLESAPAKESGAAGMQNNRTIERKAVFNINPSYPCD
jgi:hypothetical protein